jgi:hypothetical protein
VVVVSTLGWAGPPARHPSSLPRMTQPSDAAAPTRAEPALFAGLVDDAAVFPPGLAPLPVAVTEHRRHRTSWYAAMVGPLLVPASSAAELAEQVPLDAEPLRVGLIARPGTPLHTVTDALRLLREHRQVEVAAVELGWTPDWREVDLGAAGDVALVLEVPRGRDQARALDDIAAEAGGESDGRLLAKFRTGATPSWDWPDEQELAAFLHSAAARDLPFKLTGGLHHVVRGTHTVHGHTEEQHGLLNVLLAVHTAARGDDSGSLAVLLAQREPAPLARAVAGLTPAQCAQVRNLLTAYGCCGVTDPITELSALHLVEES